MTRGISRPSKPSEDPLLIELTRSSISISYQDSHSKHPLAGDRLDGLDEIIDLTESSKIASWLSTTLEKRGLHGPIEATVCIPRSAGCIHLFEVPNVADTDLHSVVELEMESVYGDSVHLYEWDFIGFPTETETKHRALLVFSILKQYIANVRSIMEASKISVKHITWTETAYGEWCGKSNRLVHIVALRDQRIEVIIGYHGTIVQAHSFPLDWNQPALFETIQGTLRRLHSSLPESIRSSPPECRILLCSTSDENQPSPPLDSLAADAQSHGYRRENFDHGKNLVYRLQGEKRWIDLANPSRRPPSPMSLRMKASWVLAASFLAMIVLWIYKTQTSAHLMQKTKETKRETNSIEKQMTALQREVDAAEQLLRWESSLVRWDQQLASICENIADAADLYVVRIQMDHPSYEDRNPMTRIEGRAKSSKPILTLTRKLADDHPNLSIQPNGIEPNSIDPVFVSQFRVEIQEALDSNATDSPQGQ